MLRLKQFAEDNLPTLFGDSWRVCLIDNNSDQPTQKKLLRISNSKHFSYIHQSLPENLKENLNLGFSSNMDFNPTIVAIWETDAVPSVTTFTSMIDLFIEERLNIASVSPMYKWHGQFCYPTHRHWHTDPIYRNHPKHGSITKVHAVPFLFSLWTPKSMQYINHGSLRPFVHLDSDFGKMLSDTGKLHLRMKEYHVGHWNGGKMTRNSK